MLMLANQLEGLVELFPSEGSKRELSLRTGSKFFVAQGEVLGQAALPYPKALYC